jgi:hypothetical protein
MNPAISAPVDIIGMHFHPGPEFMF